MRRGIYPTAAQPARLTGAANRESVMSRRFRFGLRGAVLGALDGGAFALVILFACQAVGAEPGPRVGGGLLEIAIVLSGLAMIGGAVGGGFLGAYLAGRGGPPKPPDTPAPP
jgi:hypothetical protein